MLLNLPVVTYVIKLILLDLIIHFFSSANFKFVQIFFIYIYIYIIKALRLSGLLVNKIEATKLLIEILTQC